MRIFSIIFTIANVVGLCASYTHKLEQGGLKVSPSLYDGSAGCAIVEMGMLTIEPVNAFTLSQILDLICKSILDSGIKWQAHHSTRQLELVVSRPSTSSTYVPLQ